MAMDGTAYTFRRQADGGYQFEIPAVELVFIP